MIGYLNGKVQYVSDNYIVILCGGVGYKVKFSGKKPNQNETIMTYIYTYVRENEISLYGFSDTKELSLFEMIIDISGVGPKGAMVLITNLGADNIINAILSKEAEALKVPGIGAKTTSKIILELYDKVVKLGFTYDKSKGESMKADKKYIEKIEESSEALTSLGYTPTQVKKAVSQVKYSEKTSKMSVEEIVKLLLANIS